MGTVNSNFLPATTGLNLGSSNQRWNIYASNLFATSLSLVTVVFASNPTFDGSQGSTFQMTLTANVSASSAVNLNSGFVYTFILIQDGVGSHTFAWAPNVKGGMVVDPTASITNVQQFIYNGTNLLAISAGVSM